MTHFTSFSQAAAPAHQKELLSHLNAWNISSDGCSGNRIHRGQRDISKSSAILLRLVGHGLVLQPGHRRHTFSISRDLVASPKLLYRALANSNITTWVSTPSFAEMCLVERTFNRTLLQRVRRFLFCGEILLPDTARLLLDRFPAQRFGICMDRPRQQLRQPPCESIAKS